MPFILILATLLSGSLWAQKSPELDTEKALKNQKECERIRDLNLIKTQSPLKFSCQLDNMHYYSEVPIQSDSQPVRIGNFNLLHPGTDKTLFKDFSLVAELINNDFDLIAGLEFMDVVATPRENNLKLLPSISKSMSELKSLNLEMNDLNDQIQNMKKDQDLQAEIQFRKNESLENQTELKSKKVSFEELKEEISTLSKPGITILGFEFGKAKRLEQLRVAEAENAKLESDIIALETKLIALETEIVSLESKLTGQENYKTFLDGLQQKLSLTESTSKEIESKLKQWVRYYRIPGYLRILEELRKLDSSWSLIVSPHGDAAVETNAQELVGFYYRASKVGAEKNIHCSSKFNKLSSACIPNFYADYFGEDRSNFFSRRPFLATFTDGTKNFSVLAAHVVFESPVNPEIQKNMLEKTFAVSTLSQLPTGINKNNYARFIEIYHSLLLIEKLKDEGLERIIYTGDMNLESINPFWKVIFNRFPDSKLLIDQKTSLTETRFSKGQETGGTSSNYDHFIISGAEESFCKNATVVNFMQNDVTPKIKEKYFVRAEAERGPYVLRLDAEAIISERTQETLSTLNQYNFLVNNDVKISEDKRSTEEDLKNFKQRVFDSQVSDETYYKVFIQLVSDHLPVKLECQF